MNIFKKPITVSLDNARGLDLENQAKLDFLVHLALDVIRASDMLSTFIRKSVNVNQ